MVEDVMQLLLIIYDLVFIYPLCIYHAFSECHYSLQTTGLPLLLSTFSKQSLPIPHTELTLTHIVDIKFGNSYYLFHYCYLCLVSICVCVLTLQI